MAQLLTFRLARNDSAQSWGFRLQGGKDFGTPLLIQKVNAGSLAEKAGLRIGDAVVRVNNVEVAEQRHKDAQDTIIRAGNSFDVTVQRGGLVTWKPSVSPVGSIPSPNPYECVSPVPVTKTSLAATYKPGCRPPHGFNAASKPFSPQLNGGISHDGGENGAIKAIVNKQYNSPVGIYSDESIAETLSAQAEVLAGGVLGVNFKKNEKNYNAEGSEVFKMLREAENEPKSLEIDEPRPDSNSSTTSAVAGLRHVSAPRPKSPSSSEGSSLAPGKNICADCERLIVGVFVRIKGKNLHVECFKCATCGTSLKNVGYYTINEKLYCDIHAKLVARQNPPAPNLEPATVSPVTSPQHRVSDGATWKTSPSPCRLNASPTVPVNRFSTSPSPHLTLTTNGDTINTNNTHIHSGHLTNSTTTSNNVLSSKTGIFRGQSQSLKKGTSGTGGGTIGAFQSNTASASSAGLSVPRRGKGVWNPQNVTPGARIPLCAGCNSQIRGPFVTALGKIWCPDHFICINNKCNRSLLDIGFVEEPSGLYCEYCFEQYLAPTCAKCSSKIKADCLNAIGKHFHPSCFTCAYCGKQFANNPFFLEDGLPYCENDWNELFTTKCFACGFPIEAGDRWVEALNNNYHSPCFNCSMCKTNLEGQSFYAKGGRPFCKMHSR